MIPVYLMLSAGTVFTLLTSFLYILAGDRYADLERAVDKHIYPFSFCIRAGFYLTDLLGIRTDDVFDSMFGYIVGEDKTDGFIGYCITSHAISVFLIHFSAGPLLSAAFGAHGLCVLSIAAAVLISLYPAFELRRRKKERTDMIIGEFPDVLSRLSLLISAGLTLFDAWRYVAGSSDGPLYMEMKKVSDELENGLSLREAMIRMSDRCAVKQVRRFASAVARNIDSGGGVLDEVLKTMAKDMWEEKRANAITKGKAAEQKLMLPLLLMFIGIVIMIIIPLLAEF